MSKSEILNPLAAKRKFVQSLTLKRYSKYVNDDTFLTPTKSPTIHKETVILEKTVTEEPPIVEKAQNIEEYQIVEDIESELEQQSSPDLSLPIDHSMELREDEPGERLTTYEFRRIISLLESNKKKRKEKVPDWAKLAMASMYPNSNVEYY
jgi:hypothetical protein